MAHGEEVRAVSGSVGETSSHVLLLYRDDAHRRARVVSWVQQGLTLGEKILYSTVPGDPLVSELALGEAVVPGLRQGQLSVLPAGEIFPGARQAELVHQALDEGYRGVRLSALADAVLDPGRLDEYETIDHLTDELCTSLPVSALCQLDAGVASPAALSAVIGSHGGVVEDAQMRLSRDGDRLVLAGEVDLGSADVLTQALCCQCRLDAGSAVVIEISGLAFIDVAGTRALVDGTAELREMGGGVSLDGPSPAVRRVLSLLELDRLAGMELR
jgi:anti-anti-sigma factor